MTRWRPGVGRGLAAFLILGGGWMTAAGCRAGASGPAPTAPPPGADPIVTFEITAPAGTPAADTLWISGNLPALGSWNGRGVPAEPGEGGGYRASVALPAGAAIEFKITRGSWETVEKDAAGGEIPNRRHTVAGDDTVRAVVAGWRDWSEGRPRPHTLTGDIRFHRAVASRFLGRARDVAVYLPPGYDDDPGRRFPVLYMHDGQNVFDAATSFLGIEWGVDEAAERLIAAGRIEPLIVVAVYNTPDRVAEYTPDPGAGGAGGNAAAYGRFLVEELKPMIDGAYRTLPGREHTGVAGSSLGGLVSMYLGLAHPETYSRLGVVSPSVWWADRAILARVAAAPRSETRIRVDIGTAEGSSPRDAAEAVQGARDLRDALVARGWVQGRDLQYEEASGAPHNEAAWAARVPALLEFLFPAQ